MLKDPQGSSDYSEEAPGSRRIQAFGWRQLLQNFDDRILALQAASCMPAEALRALLVEDDDSYAAMLQTDLELRSSASLQLQRVGSLADAVARLKAADFDAVLLDLGLPDSSGLETLSRLQRAAGNSAIVVLTSRDDDALAVAAVHAGAQDYLVKSTTDAQLLERSLRYACERAEFRRTLIENEARFRALVENSHEAITLIDRNMSAVYNSRSIEALTGYRPDELVGHNIEHYLHPDDVQRMRDTHEQALASPGATFQVEYRFRHKSGAYRFGEAVVVNHLNDPCVRAIVANHRDVSARKEAEEALRASEDQLRQAQKMEAVGRLAGGVAHDFNNVLTAIFGYTDLLLEQFSGDDPRRGDVLEIRKSAERAAALTRQLLAFSRKQVLQPRVIDLNEIVASLEPLLLRLAGDHAELATRPNADPWKARADPGQIEQVLMNLCANARDAVPQGGRIEIATANTVVTAEQAEALSGLKPGDYVLLSVSDTGTGIAESIRPHIFEPFFTTKEQGRGTGLGLATVYGIVKQSGGGIFVKTGEQGTTFAIYLPRAVEH